MNRTEKISLLGKIVWGNVNEEDVKRLKAQRPDVWFMVVCDNGQPNPTDLVDTRLADEQGRNQVPYGEFLKNPAHTAASALLLTKGDESKRERPIAHPIGKRATQRR